MPVSEADAVGHSWPSARGGAWPTSLSRDQASLPLTKGACLLLTWYTQQVPTWESISIHKLPEFGDRLSQKHPRTQIMVS